MKYAMSLILLVIIVSCNLKNSNNYKDGVFEGRSQSKYKDEPFVGISKVTISKGEIKTVEFSIVDTSKNELFDDKYEKHYIGVNEEYVDQCRKDWAGINRYPKVLIEKQLLESVDAVSGATWSFNMFKSSVSLALERAKN